MHVVEALDEGFDQSDPVQPHVEIVGILSLGVLIDVELVKLSRDLFDASQEAFDKDLAVLLLDITAQMNINKEVSALNRHFLVLTLNGNWPKRLNSKQVLEVHDVDDLVRSWFRHQVDVTVLSIHIQEHDLEATESLWAKACAVQLVLIAHDILKHLSATFLVK